MEYQEEKAAQEAFNTMQKHVIDGVEVTIQVCWNSDSFFTILVG